MADLEAVFVSFGRSSLFKITFKQFYKMSATHWNMRIAAHGRLSSTCVSTPRDARRCQDRISICRIFRTIRRT